MRTLIMVSLKQQNYETTKSMKQENTIFLRAIKLKKLFKSF